MTGSWSSGGTSRSPWATSTPSRSSARDDRCCSSSATATAGGPRRVNSSSATELDALAAQPLAERDLVRPLALAGIDARRDRDPDRVAPERQSAVDHVGAEEERVARLERACQPLVVADRHAQPVAGVDLRTATTCA